MYNDIIYTISTVSKSFRSEKIVNELIENKDSTFSSSYILKYNDSTFSVVVTNIKDQSIEKRISQAELDKMYYQVDEISKKQKAVEDRQPKNKRRKRDRASGPNNEVAQYIITESVIQLSILALQVILAFAY